MFVYVCFRWAFLKIERTSCSTTAVFYVLLLFSELKMLESVFLSFYISQPGLIVYVCIFILPLRSAEGSFEGAKARLENKELETARSTHLRFAILSFSSASCLPDPIGLWPHPVYSIHRFFRFSTNTKFLLHMLFNIGEICAYERRINLSCASFLFCIRCNVCILYVPCGNTLWNTYKLYIIHFFEFWQGLVYFKFRVSQKQT